MQTQAVWVVKCYSSSSKLLTAGQPATGKTVKPTGWQEASRLLPVVTCVHGSFRRRIRDLLFATYCAFLVIQVLGLGDVLSCTRASHNSLYSW